MKRYPLVLLGLSLGLATLAAQAADKLGSELLYIGTLGPDGIYSTWLDPKTGHLSSPNQAIVLSRAQWLALNPSLPVIYSVGATSGGRAVNSHIYSLAADPATGGLKLINDVDAGGLEATYLDLDARSHTLFNANHDSGSVSAFPLLADGSLGAAASVQTETGSGPNKARQEHAIAHCAVMDPSGKYVLVADLGADRIFIYRFDAATRALTAAGSQAMAPGSGPRHLVFDPHGKFLYVLTELSSEVDVLRWDAKQGQLHAVQSLSTYPADYTETKLAAEINLSHDGRFVYVSLRGLNSIVAYAVDPRAGTLKEIERIPSGGKMPYAFAIDPSGHWLLVAHGGGSVTAFKIDPATGKLSSTDQSIPVPHAAGLLFYAR